MFVEYDSDKVQGSRIFDVPLPSRALFVDWCRLPLTHSHTPRASPTHSNGTAARLPPPPQPRSRSRAPWPACRPPLLHVTG